MWRRHGGWRGCHHARHAHHPGPAASGLEREMRLALELCKKRLRHNWLRADMWHVCVLAVTVMLNCRLHCNMEECPPSLTVWRFPKVLLTMHLHFSSDRCINTELRTKYAVCDIPVPLPIFCPLPIQVRLAKWRASA